MHVFQHFFLSRNDFREACTLYNPTSFLGKMKRWTLCLSNATSEFREECFRSLDSVVRKEMNNQILAYLDIECNTLFCIECHSAFSEVCIVAMLCFETNVFPEKCANMKNHEIALLTSRISLHDLLTKALEMVDKVVKRSVVASEDSASANPNELTVEERDQHVETPSTLLALSEGQKKADKSDNMLVNMSGSDIKDLIFDTKSLKSVKNTDPESFQVSDNGHSVILDAAAATLVENPLLCENLSNLGDSTTEQCEHCLLDKCRACFVLRYFPVVNFARIRTLLSWSRRCRWRTWLACLVRLKCKHKYHSLRSPCKNLFFFMFWFQKERMLMQILAGI